WWRNLEAQRKPEDFVESLPANGCCHDMYFITDEKFQKARFFSLHGQLDTSKVRSEMVYATSKDRFKRDLDLDGTQVKLRATDPSKTSLDIVKGQAFCLFTHLMVSSS
ncbi:actin-depolymerizing factor, partial [Quercus suber]